MVLLVLKYMDIDTCLCEKTGGDYVIRTQTRPAIEFVSGEEGLRPKSFFLVLPFITYAFTDAWKYEDAPDPRRGSRGDGHGGTSSSRLATDVRLFGSTSDAVPFFPAQCTTGRGRGGSFHLPDGRYDGPLLSPCKIRRV